MWPFKKKEPDKLKLPQYPHEIFPEILDWKIGDNISDPTVSDQLEYSFYTYQGVNGNGDVFIKSNFGATQKINIKYLYKWYNVSLHERGMDEEIKSTNEYSQLIKDFQKSYEEIKLKGGEQ